MLALTDPGPLDNSDFACMHGGVLPTRGVPLADMAVPVSGVMELFGVLECNLENVLHTQTNIHTHTYPHT